MDKFKATAALTITAALALISALRGQDSSGVRMVGKLNYASGIAIDISIADDYAYVACGEAGLSVVDVSDPEEPWEVGICNTPGYALGVAVAGEYAYVADGSEGLRVVDIANPAEPCEVGFYVGYVVDVAVLEPCVFIADFEDGMKIVVVYDPTQPRRASSAYAPNARGITVLGTLAYIAIRNEGLRIVDFSDWTRIRYIGDVETPGYALGVTVSGDYAFVADGDAGLTAVNVSDPPQSLEAWSYDTPGFAYGVAVAGDYAYVADEEAGLRVLEVSDPREPREVGFYNTSDRALAVAVAENGLVYVADWSSLSIYDCSEALSAPRTSLIPYPSSLLLSAYPNPFNERATIRFNLPKPGVVTMEVYDPLGRRVRDLIPGSWLAAGEHSVNWNATGIPTGQYLLKAKAADWETAKAVVKIK